MSVSAENTQSLALESIFVKLRKAQATLTLQDDELKLRAPTGTLAREIVTEIRTHKQALINHLRAYNTAPPPDTILLTELTNAQSRLWLADKLIGKSGTFNASAAFRILGELDLELLEACLAALVSRHTSLRSRVIVQDGLPHQLIDNTPFLLHKLSTSNHEATNEEILGLANELAIEPFDLEHERSFRAHLLKISKTDHILIYCIHHVMTDEASIAIINDELWHTYEEASDGRPGELPPLELDFHTYARLSRRREHSEEHIKQLNYWTQKLAHLPTDQNLPYDRPRPNVTTNRGQVLSFILPKPVADRIKTLAVTESATTYMAMLATLHGFLHRITNDRDIVIGSPFSLRTRPEHRTLVGFLVNMLPIRVNFCDRITLRETVRDVRAAVLQAFDNSDASFGQIVDAVSGDRKTSRHPIFGINFTYRGIAPNQNVANLDITELDLYSPGSKFDLSFYAHETNDGFKMAAEYAADLFDGHTVRMLCEYFVTFICESTRDPDQSIRNIRLLTTSTERQLLEWAGTFTTYPRNRSLGDLFTEQANLSSDGIAVQHGKTSITYGDLDASSNRMAQYLLDLGIRREMLIGLCMPRSINTVIAMLAIAKIGAAYVPLDPTYPTERLAVMLEAVPINFILSSAGAHHLLPTNWAIVIDIDEHKSAIARVNEIHPFQKQDPSQLLYVMFTSGSTGIPNPVGIEQRSVIRLTQNTNYIEITPSDTILQLASLAFDASTFEIWGALLNGARLVLFDSDHFDLEKVVEYVETERVTIIFVTTAIFHRFVEQDIHRLTGLRVLLTGGEIIGDDQARKAIAALPRTTVMACYGPTEATTFSTSIALSLEHINLTVPIGCSISNSTAYVLDEQFEFCPIGVIGELYLGGDGLARGYLGKPSLTAAKFVPNPFRAGERMYRSGDLVRLRVNGMLEFIGRRDHQVKIRGFRIELAEIDAALLRIADVAQAVTIVREDMPGDKRLVAYVTITPRSKESHNFLREILKAQLPEYMIPSAIIVLDSLPLNANGKIDRLRLPKAYEQLSNVSYIAPTNEVERNLCEAWRNVLGIDQVGIDDNFFDIGGDSIIALRAQYECQRMGQEYSLRDLFVARTVRRLAELVRETSPNASKHIGKFGLLSMETRLALQHQSNLQDAYPLSRLQAGMLFHNRWSMRERDYHDVFAHRMQRPLVPTAIRQAVQACIDRHDVLRTCFQLAAFDEPVQCVLSTCSANVSIHDWTIFDHKFHKKMLDEFVAGEACHPFDLERIPPLRFFVMKLSDNELYFVTSIHHAIVDGWSLATMLREIYKNYNSILDTGSCPHWPVLPHRYRDFITIEQEALKSGENATAWANAIKFGNTHPLTVPRTHGTKSGDDKVVHEAVELGKAIASKIAETASRLRVPPKSIFLAAHLQALSLLAGGQAITTGLVMLARPEGELFDGVVGLFLNTVPICFEGRVVADDLPARAYQLELDAMRHRHYPSVEVFRKFGGRDALQTTFNFTNFHVLTDALDDLKVNNESFVADATIGLALHVTFDVDRQQCELALSYRDTTIGTSAARHYLNVVKEVLSHIMDDRPTRPLRTATQTITYDMQNMHRNVSLTASPPSFRALHSVFSEWAKNSPDVIALEVGLARFTYADLELRSNQLASALRVDHRIGPEQVVGVVLQKGIDVVVTMLAILKVGAAYCPLDPSVPPTRLKLMVSKVNAVVVVTCSDLWGNLSCSGQLTDGSGPSVAFLDSIICAGEARSQSPFVSAEPHDQSLAVVMYASSPTVTHKAIMLHHAGLYNLVNATSIEWQINNNSKVLHLAAINFDVSILEVLGALCNGATVVTVDTAEVPPKDALRHLLIDSNVTHAAITPTVLSRLQPEGLDTLTHLVVGGERCPPALTRNWSKGRHLYSSYSLAECSVAVTFSKVLTFEGQLPLGNPVLGIKIHLLSPELTPVPVGAPGEIYVSGTGLARGYMNAPRLTATKFIPNPFGGGDRLFRTGDFARRLPDDSLEYIGRQDDQVRIQDVRIELGEIDATLQSLPDVLHAVTMIREDSPDDRKLVAYVVPSNGQQLNVKALRTTLRTRLPRTMVPSTVVLIDQLPLKSNGKVNRNALPKPSIDPSFEAPTTLVQQRLCTLWAQLLRRESVGLDDDFFDMGGDSILALTLCAKMKGIVERRISPAELYAAPTVRALAVQEAVQTDQSGTIVLRTGQLGGHLVALMPNLLGTGLHFESSAHLINDQLRLVTCQLPHPPLKDMIALATYCKDWICSQGSFKTVSLVGWSFGGVLAFETARKLLQAGCEISRLVLIDTFVEHGNSTNTSIDHEFDIFIDKHIHTSWGAKNDTAVRLLWKQNFEAHLSALRCYEPSPLLMHVKEIRAAESNARTEDLSPLPALSRESIVIDGDHFSIWSETHLPTLIDNLNRFLITEES